MGGEEDLRRASHESHRSRSSFTIETPERVRKSIDRVRSIAKSNRFSVGRANSHGSIASSSKRKGSESESSIEHIAPDEKVAKVEEKVIKAVPGIADGVQAAYLLVSPLHGWVSTLATMWSSKSGREKDLEPDMKFTVDPTLALFGDDDVFVSAKRLRGWVEKLKGTEREGAVSQFRHREVSGAGHFWHDHEAVQVLQQEVKGFAASL
jgi:pimeloyl-ACP methyl ester carboxylesterase